MQVLGPYRADGGFTMTLIRRNGRGDGIVKKAVENVVLGDGK
jgi:hypothetical protein